MNKLEETAEAGVSTDMETLFCSVSLDIIGKAVFNYPFDSVTKESPVIKVKDRQQEGQWSFCLFQRSNAPSSSSLYGRGRLCTVSYKRPSIAQSPPCLTGTYLLLI